MSQPAFHLFVATPCYGGMVHQGYMRSVIELLQTGPALGVRVSVEIQGYDSLITRSRNTLVAKFLNTPGATHLRFVDADIAFEAEQIVRMLRFGEDVVAGVCPLKMICWDEAALERVRSGAAHETAPLRYVGYPAFPGTRYSAVHTGPVPDNRPNQFALFDCMIEPATGHYLSEDYAFCRRWRSIGGRIWLDTRGRLTHAGPHEFSGRPDLRFTFPNQ